MLVAVTRLSLLSERTGMIRTFNTGFAHEEAGDLEEIYRFPGEKKTIESLI